MITRGQIQRGLFQGIIQLTDDIILGGTVCKIGEYWFYFGGELAEYLTPEQYLNSVPIEEIVDEIFAVLDDFRTTSDFEDEYNYYSAILNEELNKNIHELKLRDIFADDIYFDKKSFEVRFNDRDYQVGDLVRFHVIDENDNPIPHPLNNNLYFITYMLDGWGIENGYVAFSIKKTD